MGRIGDRGNTVKTLSIALLWGAIAVFIALPPVAQAQTDAVLRSQIKTLQNQLGSLSKQFQELQKRVYTDSGANAAAQSDASSSPTDDNTARRLAIFESRLEQLEQNKLRRIEGQFDEMRNLINRMDARLEKLVADVDFRLTALESALPPTMTSENMRSSVAGNAVDGQTGTGGVSAQVEGGGGYKPSGAPRILGTIPLGDGAMVPIEPELQQTARASILPDGTAEERYKYAFGLLRKAQYDEADRVLAAFIDVHGDHPLAENASYWRGESFYARKMFGDAARIYATNLQRYPEGAKAPDNMVKLGMALANLERTKEACQAFGELDRKFPDMPANVRQAAERGRNAASCP
jgi:tol-pal system protein YbgF